MYYQPEPISGLHLHPRNRKLMDELMNAPKSYSTINGELARDAYRRHEGEPWILKRAYALAAQLKNMPIYIRDGELLTGNHTAGLQVMPRLPDDIDFKENIRANADDARYEVLGLYENFYGKLSPDAKRAQECLLAGYSAGSGDGFGHIMADYGMIIREGALELAAKSELQAKVFDDEGKIRQRDFCRASAIACRAYAGFGRRYEALAREEAAHCTDEKRRQELLRIAEICAQVPAYPARNFYEAIQGMYLTHMAMQVEQHAGSVSIGQFDRILYPYYRSDIENKTMTTDFAVELVENFCVKVMENAIWPR
ncbi:MAG: hypothetical protein LBN21_10655, partial [Treponema sp.]|nr:hypothetical protein [Treponema sp.]